MTAEHEQPRHNPEPPQGPDFPKLDHPDLDTQQIGEVGTPPNTEDVRPDLANHEPPD